MIAGIFSNLKLFLLLLTFVCSNKEVKQVVLLIAGSPPLHKGDGGWTSLYSPKKIGGGGVLSKVRE